ncbi:MAG: sulfite exporter TauE/SafE family protein [Leptospiraceae bacterium]|nr:sulfite exporter TauE/SafE family protein [Leptospiraceae bacterium]
MQNIETTNQWVLAVSIFSSAFLGSTHCLGMCGPITLIMNRSYIEHFFYHTGRLISYILLGLIAGFFGQFLFIGFSKSLIATLTPISLGLVFIYLAYNILQQKKFHIDLPFLKGLLQKQMKEEKSHYNSFLIGLLSFSLPCGWLYGYVIGAATTNNPLSGAVFMFMFWLGTVPILIFSPVLIRKIIEPFQKKFPSLAGWILLLTGIFLILNSLYRIS